MAYTYDAVGNRISDGTATYSYDVNDRLLTVGSIASYTYDASGNVTQRTLTSGTTSAVTALRWNAENQLTGATLPDSTQIAYTYDCDGEFTREVRGTDGAASGITLYLANRTCPSARWWRSAMGQAASRSATSSRTRNPSSRGGNLEPLSLGSPIGEPGDWEHGSDPQFLRLQPLRRGNRAERGDGKRGRFAGERLNSDLALYYDRAR